MAGGVDIIGFAASARPGDRLEYGRGENPPRELVRSMRQLVDAGVLHPVRVREGAEFRFLIERGRGDFTGHLSREQVRRRQSRGAVRRRRAPRSVLTIVFECIARAARKGEPCPTNEEIAARCGLSGRKHASYRVQQLVAAKRIAIEDRSPWGRRIATILDGPHAGKQTCEAAL